MRYNVSQLLKEPVGATRHYEMDDFMPSPQEGAEELRVQGIVDLLRTRRGILVTGDLRTAVVEECSRCLDPFEEPLTLASEEEFFPLTDVNTGVPLGMPEEAGPFIISERHILDLSEAARQAILIARPIQPLCRPDCRGLCPECGANLNQGPCQCQPAMDPRWATLAQRVGAGGLA